jgi:hypothetical protein
MLNFDMVGRVRNNVLSVGGTGTAASFEEMLKKADDASPLELKNFGKGGFGPSDHMSFALKQIPVLFFWSGNHGDYHRPTDDADKINYDGIEQVIQPATGVVDTLRTRWGDESVDSLYTLTDLLAKAKPGNKVKLTVTRDGKPVELDATLAERKG